VWWCRAFVGVVVLPTAFLPNAARPRARVVCYSVMMVWEGAPCEQARQME